LSISHHVADFFLIDTVAILCLKQGDQIGQKLQFGLLFKGSGKCLVENSAQNGRAILSKESFLHFHLKSSFKAGFVVAILKVQKWCVVYVLDF
jgi:hypothetical protein